MHISELTTSGFRCFRDDQRVHLAPLTLLVGENSTGKTSILALVRALWDVAFRQRPPNFKEAPYDLGSFDDIAHYRGGRGGRAQEFRAGFSVSDSRRSENRFASRYLFTFQKDGSAPSPRIRRIENRNGDTWAEIRLEPDDTLSLRFATPNGEWHITNTEMADMGMNRISWDLEQRALTPLRYLLYRIERHDGFRNGPAEDDIGKIATLERGYGLGMPRPFAGAPVRSRPYRNYDPSHTNQDAEGEYIPMLLYNIYRHNRDAWGILQSGLEQFGQDSGLFDEIRIQSLGGKDSDPFQIQVRKHGRHGRKSLGPYRNIIDVGYGVSQVLPIITEILRQSGPRMFLLQQPEVHLHPSAQAALGSLFCTVVGNRKRLRKQMIVETHSDHLIDRIRMDIRDERGGLRAEDVSILYFRRGNLGVTIHSLGWDADGNLNARDGSIPDGYREFFRSERRRSLGL